MQFMRKYAVTQPFPREERGGGQRPSPSAGLTDPLLTPLSPGTLSQAPPCLAYSKLRHRSYLSQKILSKTGWPAKWGRGPS